MNNKIRFISFEGIEGCGKSTQSKKLYEYFLAKQLNCLLTREPGGSSFGEKIRSILLDEIAENLNPKTELLLNFASRIEHVDKIIKPALEKNHFVICDRFFDSTYAYQGGAQGVDINHIDQIKQIAIEDFAPDITFFIKVDVEEGLRRVANRGKHNRFDRFGFDFHQKVHNQFLELAKKNSRIKIIDGMQNQQEVFEKILTFINHN